MEDASVHRRSQVLVSGGFRKLNNRNVHEITHDDEWWWSMWKKLPAYISFHFGRLGYKK